MRKKRYVEVIANKPKPGQASIAHLIGKRFEVIVPFDPEDGTISITPNLPGDLTQNYVLQKGEYKFVWELEL